MMKTALKVVAVLIFLASGVWFLQGMNNLPGRFMSGYPQWAINGGTGMVIGVGLSWSANRK